MFEGERGKCEKVFERCTTCSQSWVYTGLAEQESVNHERHRESGCVGTEMEWLSDDPDLDALLQELHNEDQDLLGEIEQQRRRDQDLLDEIEQQRRRHSGSP